MEPLSYIMFIHCKLAGHTDIFPFCFCITYLEMSMAPSRDQEMSPGMHLAQKESGILVLSLHVQCPSHLACSHTFWQQQFSTEVVWHWTWCNIELGFANAVNHLDKWEAKIRSEHRQLWLSSHRRQSKIKDSEGDWVKRKKISRKETAMPLTFTSLFCLCQMKRDGRTILTQGLY